MYVGQDVIYESPNLHRSSVANPGALDCVRRDVGHFVHNVCFSARYEYGIIKFHLVLLGRVGFNFVVSFSLFLLLAKSHIRIYLQFISWVVINFEQSHINSNIIYLNSGLWAFVSKGHAFYGQFLTL